MSIQSVAPAFAKQSALSPPAPAATCVADGHPVTPAQVVLCMLDLKLARLRRDPGHQDSMVDVIGYAALLNEVTR